jgi:3-deoxy-D-manno-octulosonic-acid transferase
VRCAFQQSNGKLPGIAKSRSRCINGQPMIVIYRLLYLPALLVLMPYYALRMWRRGGYGAGFSHRFGRMPELLSERVAGRRRIWIQAVSVGELLAIEPLVRALAARADCAVLLTTTTSTGYRLARQKYAELTAAIALFPLDFWPCTRWAWRRWQPDLVVLTESELWPEHIHQARRRGIPSLLINGRLSDRSFARHLHWRERLAPLYRSLHAILAATPVDAERYAALQWGPPVSMIGNLKFDLTVDPPPLGAARRQALHAIGLAAGDAAPVPFVILGSSTWPGEEQALLEALAAVRRTEPEARLLLVPRHAERRPELERLLAGSPFSHHFRSRGHQPPGTVDVYVADTTGELRLFTALADLVFIGKSLPPHHEGQTPIEAAALGRPMISGPQLSNFRSIAADFVAAGLLLPVADHAQLVATVRRLHADPAARAAMAAACARHFDHHRGATQRIVAHIESLLNSKGQD